MGLSHIHIHDLERIADGQALEKGNPQVITCRLEDYVSVLILAQTIILRTDIAVTALPGESQPSDSTSYPLLCICEYPLTTSVTPQI